MLYIIGHYIYATLWAIESEIMFLHLVNLIGAFDNVFLFVSTLPGLGNFEIKFCVPDNFASN